MNENIKEQLISGITKASFIVGLIFAIFMVLSTLFMFIIYPLTIDVTLGN